MGKVGSPGVWLHEWLRAFWKSLHWWENRIEALMSDHEAKCNPTYRLMCIPEWRKAHVWDCKGKSWNKEWIKTKSAGHTVGTGILGERKPLLWGLNPLHRHHSPSGRGISSFNTGFQVPSPGSQGQGQRDHMMPGWPYLLAHGKYPLWLLELAEKWDFKGVDFSRLLVATELKKCCLVSISLSTRLVPWHWPLVIQTLKIWCWKIVDN